MDVILPSIVITLDPVIVPVITAGLTVWGHRVIKKRRKRSKRKAS